MSFVIIVYNGKVDFVVNARTIEHSNEVFLKLLCGSCNEFVKISIGLYYPPGGSNVNTVRLAQ